MATILALAKEDAISHPMATVLLALVSLASFYMFTLLYFPKASVWANMPGPSRTSWWLGNSTDSHIRMDEAHKGQKRQPALSSEGDDLLDVPGAFNWTQFQDFNSDHVVYPRPLGGQLLLTRDAATINHILGDSTGYQRSAAGTKATKLIIGDGIVAVFGEEHRKQRRMVGPAFGVEQLRGFVPLFFDLTDQMMDKMTEDKSLESRWGKGVLDPVKWFGRITLDIIGRAGFDYDFEAVQQGPNGMSVRSAFHAAMTATMNIKPLDALVGAFLFFVVPKLHYLPVTDNVRKMRVMRSELIKTSQMIVAIKAKQIREEMQPGSSAKDSFSAKKDILHLCMRANMSPDVKESDRLSDTILAGQIVTFIFAGHETTATTLSWCLYFLAMNPKVQDELRASLVSAIEEIGKEDDLNSLNWNELNSPPFKMLENSLVETLRLRPPVSTTFRYAYKDDQVPVSTPIKTKDGRTLTHFPMQAGQEIAISITGNNMDPKYFGSDTHIYNPSRWNNLPEAHANAKMPPPFGSFVFNGGPKVCIGNRFAMTEMKVILLKVLLKWKIEPIQGIKLKSIEAVVQRPAVVGSEHEGSQLPVRFLDI